MEKTENVGELFKALALAQGQICNAKKDSVNPFFKSKYADLAEVINVSKEALSSNGLCVMQFPSHEGEIVTVTTVIGHSSGEWMKSDVSAVADKMDIQTVGKLITYLRRYAYSAVVGIAQEDDDGQAAAQKAPAKRPTFTSENLAKLLPHAMRSGWTCEEAIHEAVSNYTVSGDMQDEIVKYYADVAERSEK